jgi:hypothetical protein
MIGQPGETIVEMGDFGENQFLAQHFIMVTPLQQSLLAPFELFVAGQSDCRFVIARASNPFRPRIVTARALQVFASSAPTGRFAVHIRQHPAVITDVTDDTTQAPGPPPFSCLERELVKNHGRLMCESTSSLDVSPFHNRLPSENKPPSEGSPAEPVSPGWTLLDRAIDRAGKPGMPDLFAPNSDRKISTACSHLRILDDSIFETKPLSRCAAQPPSLSLMNRIHSLRPASQFKVEINPTRRIPFLIQRS